VQTTRLTGGYDFLQRKDNFFFLKVSLWVTYFEMGLGDAANCRLQRYFLLKILAYGEIFKKRKRYKSLWLSQYYIRVFLTA